MSIDLYSEDMEVAYELIEGEPPPPSHPTAGHMFALEDARAGRCTTIYGRDGWNRYFVKGMKVYFSRSHAHNGDVEKAQMLGFDIW
jgi:hypothetical protein